MLELFVIIGILVLDQASKIACAAWLPTLPNQNYPLFEGVFELSYVENRGAAFGMLQNARWFFIAVTLAAVAVILWLMIKKRGMLHKTVRICLALVLSGAVRNLIDRAFLGYVRDMFYFALIDFAVFNVADAAISVGGVWLVLDLLLSAKGKALMAALDGKAPKPEEAAPADGGAAPEDASAQGEEKKP